MMNAYLCEACGQTSYSATREENMTDARCPYCGGDPADKPRVINILDYIRRR